jgi:DNA repair exonuclease SbcCD ATPase subunit
LIQQKLEFEANYRQLNDKHESLKKNYNTLQEDYNEQQQILEDIRLEASNLLKEIKSLSNENLGLKDESSKYKRLVDDLKKEASEFERQRSQQTRQIESLQSQLEQLKQQTRDLERQRTTQKPIVHSRTMPNIDFQKDGIHPTSVYKIERIKPYCVAVDQLLDEVRKQREPSTNVIVAMRAIVVACKTITEDCDAFESRNSLAPLDKESIARIKQQLSTCLTLQMKNAKECATTANESGVKVLYESTCALTSVVVDLITTVNRIVDQTLANSMMAEPPKSSYNLQELKVTKKLTRSFLSSKQIPLFKQSKSCLSSCDFRNQRVNWILL